MGIVREQTSAATSGTTHSVTFVDAQGNPLPPLDATHGLLVAVRRTGGAAPAPTNPVPSGWTLIDAEQSAGTTKTWLGWYAIRCNGSVNGLGPIEGATANVQMQAFAVDNVKSPTWWNQPTWTIAETGTGAVIPAVTTQETDSTVIAMVALGPTAGGTGISFTGPGMVRGDGASQFATTGWAVAEPAASGTTVTCSAAWTNTGVNVSSMISLNTATPATSPPAGPAPTQSTRRYIDFTAWTNATSVSLTRTSGPTVTTRVENPLVVSFLDIEGRTADIVFSYTVTGTGGTTTGNVTAPPAGTAETIRVGTIIRGADGLIR